jgi:hypothetical protein
MNTCEINEDFMEGIPILLKRVLIRKTIIALQDYIDDNENRLENVGDNLKLIADVIEEIEEHINDKHIKFVYNPMGAWVRVEEKEEK